MQSTPGLFIVRPEYFSNIPGNPQAQNPVGGDLYTAISQHNGFDVEIDHFAIFLPDKTGFIYRISDSEDCLLAKFERFDFICTTACGPCVTICAHVDINNNIYQAIAHISTVHSLNDVLALLLQRMIEHLPAAENYSICFYLFGGTEESMEVFLAQDEDIEPPDDLSYADSYPRLYNKGEDNMSIILLNSKIIILQFDGDFKNIKNDEQAFNFESDPKPYDEKTNPNGFVFLRSTSLEVAGGIEKVAGGNKRTHVPEQTQDVAPDKILIKKHKTSEKQSKTEFFEAKTSKTAEPSATRTTTIGNIPRKQH